MTHVYLIRHGHVDNPHDFFYGPDAHLSEDGKKHIALLAQDFITADIRPTHIYSSPYKRTHETADIFAAHFPLIPVTFVENLKEWQVGGWYDKPLADFYAATGYRQDATRPLPPDIEPLEDCAHRIQSAIQKIVQENPHETIFIISHREPMVSAILKWQGKSWESIHDFPLNFASAWKIEFENTTKPVSIQPVFDRSET